MPLVIKKNLFSLSNVSLGYGKPYPLQIAGLTEEVTAAQCGHAPKDGVLAPDACAARNKPYRFIPWR